MVVCALPCRSCVTGGVRVQLDRHPHLSTHTFQTDSSQVIPPPVQVKSIPHRDIHLNVMDLTDVVWRCLKTLLGRVVEKADSHHNRPTPGGCVWPRPRSLCASPLPCLPPTLNRRVRQGLHTCCAARGQSGLVSSSLARFFPSPRAVCVRRDETLDEKKKNLPQLSCQPPLP
jgi:hypothetical protein